MIVNMNGMIKNLIQRLNSETPHWIFLYGGAYLMELRNPKIPYRDYANLTKSYATYEDIPDIINFADLEGSQGIMSPEAICEQRLERGDLIHLIRDGDRMVNIVWIFKGKFYIRGYGLKYDTGDDALYLYNGYTAPDMRMKGIINLALADIAEYALKNGRSKFIALIETDNEHSLRFHKRLNFKIIESVEFVKIFGIKFKFYKRENKRFKLNIHLLFPKGYTVI
jgi:hypothetical protein